MQILQSLNRSWLTTLTINIFLVALWWIPYLLNYRHIPEATISVFNIDSIIVLTPPIAILLQFITSILMFIWVSRFLFSKYINIVTYLQFSMMMLLYTTWGSAQIFGNHIISSALLMVALLEIIKIDFSQNNIKEIFNTFTALVIASIFQIDFLFFIPLFILGVFILDGFKRKSVLTIIFVLFVGVASIIGYAYVFDIIDDVVNYYRQILNLEIATYSLSFVLDNIAFFITIIFSAISLFFYFQNQSNFRFNTKRTMAFLIMIWICLTLYMMMFVIANNGLSLFYIILSSLFLSLCFIDYRSKHKNIIFIILLIFLCLNYILRLSTDMGIDIKTYTNSLLTVL